MTKLLKNNSCQIKLFQSAIIKPYRRFPSSCSWKNLDNDNKCWNINFKKIAGRLPENSRNSFVDLQSQKTVNITD